MFRAENADLKILIADSSLMVEDILQQKASLPAMAHRFLNLEDSVTQSFKEILATDTFKPEDTLVVLNKVDLIPSEEGVTCLKREKLQEKCEGAEVCTISCKTGQGVDLFMGHLQNILKTMSVQMAENILMYFVKFH